VSVDAARRRSDTPSTGCAGRERVRRAPQCPGWVARRACDRQVGAFPDAGRRVSRRAADHRLGRGAFRGTRPPGGAVGCRTLSWARRTRHRVAPGLAHSPRLPACSRRFTSAASPCRGGWVGCTTGSCGCSGGRPRRGHRPVCDETTAVACYATGCGPVLATGRPWNLGCDQRNRDLGCTPAAGVPFLLIMGLCVGPVSGGGLAVVIQGRGWVWRVGTTASRVAPGRTVSSRSGVPPRRGRLPEQPHDSVVHPTQPPRQGEGGEGPAEPPTREARVRGRAPGDPGRERRAHRRVTDQTDPLDRHERPDRHAPDRAAGMIRTIGCPRLPPRP
jgi:hypothetical protein